MREILFRGKLPDGEWAEGYIVKGRCTYILTAENIHYMSVSVMGHASVDVLPVERQTIGQYTGLKDKNGKRIFEGDIVYIPRLGKAYEVKYRLGQFFVGINGPIAYERHDCEVIGNIHDNPEMIGGAEE